MSINKVTKKWKWKTRLNNSSFKFINNKNEIKKLKEFQSVIIRLS